MMFRDRKDAGLKLAVALEEYLGQEGVLVLAIPKGGIAVGLEVARHLGAEFSVIVCRKLPLPLEPEAGFGALAEDGTLVLQPGAERWLAPEEIEEAKAEAAAEIKRRVALLRGGRPLPRLKGRTVVLVDDGLAMGSTMKAAVGLCRRRRAGRVVVAVPVAGARVKAEISRLADETVVLETPPGFRAVAQVYARWYDVPDAEAVAALESWNEPGAGRR
jgi:putative phosphoribosyl transferase